MQKVDTTNLRKTTAPGYYTDPKTGTIINTNDDQLRSYLHGREQVKEFTSLKQSYSKLEDELTQIKKALGI